MKITGLTLLACFPLLLVVLLCVFGVLSLSSPGEVKTLSSVVYGGGGGGSWDWDMCSTIFFYYYGYKKR